MTRRSQRGSAILVTMIVVVALLGGGAVLLAMQVQSTRSVETSRTGMTALYCAEAGLNAVRAKVAADKESWNEALAGCNPGPPRWFGDCTPGDLSESGLTALATHEPRFLRDISRDLDGDSVADFIITMIDNEDDEFPPGNPFAGVTIHATDADSKVYVFSTCIKFADHPKQVVELIAVGQGGQGIPCIKTQKGGCRGMGGGQ